MINLLRSRIEKVIFLFQFPLFYISYYLCCITKEDSKIIIGVDEIANMIFSLSRSIDRAITVSFSKNRYYSSPYNFTLPIKNKYFNFIARVIYGPILLGFLIRKSSCFIYVWNTGFTLNREFEFKIIKKKRKK